MYIMSIIYMTMNFFNYFQLFHSNWNNCYNSTTSQCRTPCRTVPSTLFAFITCCGTIPMPMSWQTTSCTRPQNPAGGRRALPESDCAGGGEWFRCRRLELPTVFPGSFPLVCSTYQYCMYWYIVHTRYVLVCTCVQKRSCRARARFGWTCSRLQHVLVWTSTHFYLLVYTSIY